MIFKFPQEVIRYIEYKTYIKKTSFHDFVSKHTNENSIFCKKSRIFEQDQSSALSSLCYVPRSSKSFLVSLHLLQPQWTDNPHKYDQKLKN
jgi:hypothetical protein